VQPRRRVEELAAQRVMSAMLQVTKIDIAELERGVRGGRLAILGR
jgi:hypothetical protein